MFGLAGIGRAKALSLADAIADFRDPDSLRRAHGAEDGDYRGAGLAWGPKNAPFESVEELKQVLGMTPSIYARVAPRLTVFAVQTSLPPDLREALKGVVPAVALDVAAAGNAQAFIFSIRAEASNANGGSFIREAVVQANAGQGRPWVLSWPQGIPPSGH